MVTCSDCASVNLVCKIDAAALLIFVKCFKMYRCEALYGLQLTSVGVLEQAVLLLSFMLDPACPAFVPLLALLP